MSEVLYHFGRCVLHTGARELRLDGQPRKLERLAFDVLAYLLRHREREVSTEELLDEVWLGRVVTVGAVARAMVVVRRAIGDGQDGELIRTVHRVGYRFVGQVVQTIVSAPGGAQPVRAAVPLALLPMDNLTGNLSLDWTPIGLMALVGSALSLDSRLAPATVHAVLDALKGVPRDARLEHKVAAVRHRCELDHVVHTSIRTEAGGYRLDYRLESRPAVAVQGWVFASSPVRLGRALARRLSNHLLGGQPAGEDRFAKFDPWAMQLLARAVHAESQQEWALAQAMLRVVIDLEPECVQARQELAHVQARATTSGSS